MCVFVCVVCVFVHVRVYSDVHLCIVCVLYEVCVVCVM